MSKMSKIFPNIYVKRITLDSIGSELDVNIDFCLSFKKNPTAPAGLLRQCWIYKDFRALVVQITDPILDANLQKLSPESLAERVLAEHKSPAYQSTFSKDVGYRTFSLINPILTKNEDSSRFEISFHTDDSFRMQGNVHHLSYIFLTYLDNEHNLFDVRVGPPVVERVIKAGKVIESASAFFVKGGPSAGKQYSGPVHQYMDTWMAGEKHVSEAHHALEKVEVFNTTIQDLRIFNKLGNVSYVFNHDPPANVSHFSDIALSRTIEGDCRYSFSINFAKMI